jgi:hypothetical protein
VGDVPTPVSAKSGVAPAACPVDPMRTARRPAVGAFMFFVFIYIDLWWLIDVLSTCVEN